MHRPGVIDILFITYNRPAYTRLSLTRLLDTCDERMRVWLWHNGSHAETLALVRSFSDHPRVHRFHHCPENLRLRAPINWLMRHADGDYFSKVDDDCLMPRGWGERMREAHTAEPRFGALGCWNFMAEDFDAVLAAKKIREYGGQTVLENCWVAGSGWCMKRACYEDLGPLEGDGSFPWYCKRLAARGWVNGWPLPLMVQEHMDDPRSEHCVLKTDEDLLANMPLTAQRFGITTIEGRIEQIRRHARDVQTASLNPAAYRGLRAKVRRLVARKVKALLPKAA